MVAGLVRTIFAQPDAASARTQLAKVVEGLKPRSPRAAALLEEAEEDVLAYIAFPRSTGGSSTPRTPWSGCTGPLDGRFFALLSL